MKNNKRTSSFSFAKKGIDLDKLSPRRLAKYEDSLEVLRLMRNNDISLSQASKMVQISPSTVKRNVGNALQKKNKRIIPRKNDNLLRKMRIYENGKEVWIQVRGNKKAATIAQYHGATGRLLNQGKTNAMKTFENQFIIDSKGKKHKFETSTKKLQDIAERREEAEFFTIYTGGN
jgi:predicted DNA-binding protein (UPF0251 family)